MRSLLLFLSLLSLPALGQFDFGDAPDTYGTLLPGGARHTVSADIRLGATVDSELNGQPNANADGDGSDDDGVTVAFTPPTDPFRDVVAWQIGSWTQLRVQVDLAGAVEEAGLDGWVDFNRDGDFADAGEHVFDNERVKKLGPNQNDGLGHTLGVLVPENVSPGVTYARFRISQAGGLGPAGPGASGEVEDYRITLVSPSQATGMDAWARDGQVWITWDFDPLAPAQTYEVYKSTALFVNVSAAQRVSRLFPQEYAGRNLRSELRQAFGGAARDHFTIPGLNAGDPPVTLAAGKGLCVDTIRSAGGPWFYAVVPHGQTTVNAGGIIGPVSTPFHAANLPRIHVMQSGLVGDGSGANFSVSVLNF